MGGRYYAHHYDYLFCGHYDSSESARIDRPLEVSDLKDSDRQWVSIYEGKNRVELDLIRTTEFAVLSSQFLLHNWQFFSCE